MTSLLISPKHLCLRKGKCSSVDLFRRVLSTTAQKVEAAFSDSNTATFLAAATTAGSIPKLQGLSEVIVAGRANAGKSTILNAVLNRKELVRTSKKAGRTKALNFFRVGKPPGSLVLVDSPGYGMRGRIEWGELWNHYIDSRKELRLVCILINSKHGVTNFDQAMLEDLQSRLKARSSPSSSSSPLHVPILQPVLTKIDTLEGNSEELSSAIRAMSADISKFAPMASKPILCSVTNTHRLGLDALRVSIANACGT